MTQLRSRACRKDSRGNEKRGDVALSAQYRPISLLVEKLAGRVYKSYLTLPCAGVKSLGIPGYTIIAGDPRLSLFSRRKAALFAEQ